MKYRRLLRRSLYVMGTASLMMLAFWVGRITIRMRYFDLGITLVWVGVSGMYLRMLRIQAQIDKFENIAAVMDEMYHEVQRRRSLWMN